MKNFKNTIKTVEIRNNMYTNGNQLVITIDCPISEVEPEVLPVYEDERGVLHLGNNDGLVNFGFLTHKEEDRPDHGGMWTSNSEAVYDMTGLASYEVTLVDSKGYRWGVAITQELVKEIMPDGYALVYGSKYINMPNHYYIKTL